MSTMRHLTVAIALAVAGLTTSACKPAPPPEPPPRPAGTVTITTAPAGAAVYKDRRERLGITPLKLTLPDESLLNLTLVKDGHENHQISVMVESGKNKKVHQDLALASGTVLVDAGFVKGGRIFVEGEYRSKTPDKVTVPAGKELLVEVKQDDYHPYRERVTVQPGKTVRINAILVPVHHKKLPGGWLTLSCDPPAAVSINDKSMGETPLERVPLPEGDHQIKLYNVDLGLSSTRTVQIKASEATRIHVKLKDEADH